MLHASTYESDTAVLQLRPDLAGEPRRKLVKVGYKAQSSVVVSHLERLVAMWHGAGHSAIVEGVHLHLKAVMRLMQTYPSILPFLVHCCLLPSPPHQPRITPPPLARVKWPGPTRPAASRLTRQAENGCTIDPPMDLPCTLSGWPRNPSACRHRSRVCTGRQSPQPAPARLGQRVHPCP